MNENLKTNVLVEGDDIQMIVNVPGIKKENISIILDNGILNISVDDSESLNKDKKYLLKERDTKYSRSFKLDNVDLDNINAEIENGQLFINLKKNQSKSIEIK